MHKKGIHIYDNIVRNKIIYSNFPPEAIFSFAGGARIDFISKNPNSLCDIIMIEKGSGIIHYETRLHGGTFAKSNRKEISPLIIKAIDMNGKILLNIDLEEWAKENL